MLNIYIYIKINNFEHMLFCSLGKTCCLTRNCSTFLSVCTNHRCLFSIFTIILNKVVNIILISEECTFVSWWTNVCTSRFLPDKPKAAIHRLKKNICFAFSSTLYKRKHRHGNYYNMDNSPQGFTV